MWSKTRMWRKSRKTPSFQPSSELNAKVSICKGDITKLEVDAIVNSVHGDGEEDLDYYDELIQGPTTTVADCIYKAGGKDLLKELCELNDWVRNEAVVTHGHQLPAKYVIHVNGPFGYDKNCEHELRTCYTDALFLAEQKKCRSIAFPCISAGGKGVQSKRAAEIALGAVRNWLEDIKNINTESPAVTIEALDLASNSNTKKNDSPASEELRQALNRQTIRATQAETSAERLQTLVTSLQRSSDDRAKRIQEDARRILALENTVRRLEGELYTSQVALGEAHQEVDRLDRERRDMELKLSNSDRIFQEVLQRLIGQIPQSQPFWVVSRQEIHLTGETIGEGGWAQVKVAVFRGQKVAAKCLHNQIISAHNIRLFTREMNIAAQARHPNLLQFIGATMEGEPIILTELMSTSLRHLMETTRLNKLQIISLASDVARALNYLHLTSPDPIIHRDISSANILLESIGEGSWKAKVSDYGSANFCRYTTTIGPGNPLYSAPEAVDPKKQSVKMDVYSFGILLIEMCSGELFEDYEELIRTHVEEWPAMLNLVHQCIHQIPQRRPNMSEVTSQLDIIHTS